MDNTANIFVEGLFNIDYNKVNKKIVELQQYVDRRPIQMRVDFDANAYQQMGQKINIFQQQIRQSVSAIQQQSVAINNVSNATNTYINNINQAGQNAQEATKHTNGWTDSLKRMIGYYISFQAAINLVRQSVNTLKDMDSLLTETSKVINITRNDFKQLGLEALETASKYGRAVQDTLAAQTSFAKAGFQNYKQMSELSLMTQSAGDMNEKLASSYLISSDKAFKYGGSIEKLTALLDSQNQISNRHAITMEFLAEATQVAGNAMRLAGETEQTATAAWTAIGVATQRSGSEVGKATRTIEMRIQAVKQAFEGLDFEINIDGEKEIVNAQELSDGAKALKEIGIEVIRLEDGKEKFATMTEIAAQLAEKLDEGTISATKMNKIVGALAGQNRAEYFLALVNNMDEYSRAMQNFTDAQGSALEEAMKQALSLEGRLNALKNTWTSFIASTLDSSMFIGVLNSLNFIVTGFNNLGTALGIVAAAFITLKLPSMITWFQTLALQTKLLSMEVASAGGFFNLLKVAFTGTATSAGTAAAAITALQIAVGAAVAVISIGIMAWNHWNQAQKEARQRAIDYADTASQQANKLNDLYVQYERLSNISNRTTADENLFKDVQSQIIPLLGERKRALEDLTEGTKEYSQALKELTESELTEQLNDVRKGRVAAADELKKFADAGLFGWGNKGTMFGAAYSTGDSVESQINKIMQDYVGSSSQGIPVLEMPKDAEKQLDFYAKLKDSLSLLDDEYNKLWKSGDQAGAEAIAQGKLYKDLADLMRQMDDPVSKYIELKVQESQIQYVLANGYPKTVSELDTMKESVFGLIGANEEFRSQTYDMIDNMFPSLAQVSKDAFSKGYEDELKKIEQDYADRILTATEYYNALSDLRKKHNMSETLDLEAMNKKFLAVFKETAERVAALQLY